MTCKQHYRKKTNQNVHLNLKTSYNPHDVKPLKSAIFESN